MFESVGSFVSTGVEVFVLYIDFSGTKGSTVGVCEVITDGLIGNVS